MYSTKPLVELSREEAENKGRELMRLIDTDIEARSIALRRRAMLREMYAGLPDSMVDSEDGVTIHLPVIAEKIDGTVPKVVNAFWNAEPIVHVRRIAQEFNAKAAELIERFMGWALLTDIADFYQVFEQWIRNCCIDGVSVIKLYWHYTERITVITQHAGIYWRAGDTDLSNQPVPEDRLKLPIEILYEIFGNNPQQKGVVEVHSSRDGAGNDYDLGAELGDFVGFHAMLDIVENRILYEDVEVEFHPSQYIDEITVTIKRPIIVCDSPRAVVVEFDDIVVPFRTANLQEAPRVTHLCSYTEARFRAIAERCHYELDDEDWEKLTARLTVTPETENSHQQNAVIKQQKDRQIGEEDEGTDRADVEYGTYGSGLISVREVYASDDLDGDGRNEEVIYIIPEALKRVVRTYYLDELFPHGRRPFIDLHFRKESDRWYSTGMAELLFSINMEVDAIISMVNYAQELINNPFYFYEPTTFVGDAKAPRNLRPGEGKMVASVNGVMFPKFMQEPLANLSTMDSLLLFADRLTLSPQSMGSSQVRNAPRTARGTLALLSEAGIKTDMFITAAQYGPWRELLHQIHALYGAFGPDEKFFYVTGEKAPRQIAQDQLRGRYEFAFSGNTVNTNKEVMRSIAQLRYTTLVSNPLFTMDLPAMQNLIRDFLKHFDEGSEIETLVPRTPEQGGDHSPMDQKTEIRYITQGTPMGVLPTDDHAQHLNDLMTFQNSQEFKMLEPWKVAMLAMHGALHAQAIQRQQLQGGALAASGPTGGEANNQPSNTAQLSNLEGGVQ